MVVQREETGELALIVEEMQELAERLVFPQLQFQM